VHPRHPVFQRALRARTADELLFRGELDDLAARRGARAVYLRGADREPLSAAGSDGSCPISPSGTSTRADHPG
jgi:hypothetical protein